MFLSKPCFPVSFAKEEVDALVKKTLGRKYWRDYNTSKTSLFFEPYYLFTYDALFEEKSEETGALVAKDTESGDMALNAVSGEFDEKVAPLIEEQEPEILKASPAPEGVEVEIERAYLSEAEVKKIVPMRLAAKLGVARQNIELSGFTFAFIPFWRIDVEVNEKEYELVVNAVTGEIAPEDEIPYREKSILELVGETVSELRSPNAWVEYSQRVLQRIVESEILHSIGKAILTNRYVQIAIVVVILAVAFWPKPA